LKEPAYIWQKVAQCGRLKHRNVLDGLALPDLRVHLYMQKEDFLGLMKLDA